MQFKHLRHTFNTRLMEAGVIQDVRSALMGHAQGRPRTTNDIYTHVELPMLREAIAKLEQWVKQKRQQLQKEELIGKPTDPGPGDADDSGKRLGGDSGGAAAV